MKCFCINCKEFTTKTNLIIYYFNYNHRHIIFRCPAFYELAECIKTDGQNFVSAGFYHIPGKLAINIGYNPGNTAR